MAVRTTIDIPESLHEKLRVRAEQGGTSIRALIIRAIEQSYVQSHGAYVTGPLIANEGKLGPSFPIDENPHELVFS